MRINNVSEDSEQISLMKALALYPSLYKYVLHIPNGGSRNIIEASKLKLMGVKAGVPDIFLAKASNGYHGLWIELKRLHLKKGIVTNAQQEWIDRLNEAGYKAVVCFGWSEAFDTVLKYANIN